MKGQGNDVDPAPTDDTVVIFDYDPRWPLLFEAEHACMQSTLAPFAVSIEHVGSTSVPGLCAKPVVDMLVTVERLEPAERYAAVLAPFGYVLRVDPANTERHAFGKRDAHGRRIIPGHNLHVVEQGGAELRAYIKFRDYLRTHPDAARDYCALKRRLAAEYGTDRDAYTDAKGPFIRAIEAT
jgi:GrpB-like predicted nucleotidyltransferase (UPF0157 family)